MGKRTMSLQDACALVPDDLSDGAYWAMVHEIAGAEYGTAWHELDEHPNNKKKANKAHACDACMKKFATTAARDQHSRDAHAAIAKATGAAA